MTSCDVSPFQPSLVNLPFKVLAVEAPAADTAAAGAKPVKTAATPKTK